MLQIHPLKLSFLGPLFQLRAHTYTHQMQATSIMSTVQCPCMQQANRGIHVVGEWLKPDPQISCKVSSGLPFRTLLHPGIMSRTPSRANVDGAAVEYHLTKSILTVHNVKFNLAKVSARLARPIAVVTHDIAHEFIENPLRRRKSQHNKSHRSTAIKAIWLGGRTCGLLGFSIFL